MALPIEQRYEQYAGPALTPVSTMSVAPVQTVASDPAWNYDEYVSKLKSGNTDFNQELGKLGGSMATNAQNLYAEILAQQGAGSSEFWYKGNTASKEAAAADFALRLAENGVGSLNDLGQATVPGAYDSEMGGNTPDQQVTINKATGQPLPRPELLGRGTRGLDIDYNLAFTENGQVIPYTSNRESSWMSFRENALKPAAAFALAAFGAPMIGAAVAPGLAAATQGAIGGALVGGGTAALTGGDILKGALLGAGGGYLQGSGALSSGFGPQTDASFLANDAAKLAAQGLSEAQIADILGGVGGYASGSAANLAASMAVNGLDVGLMTQQLDALSTNTGLMSQTGSSADFAAADALKLRDQVGNNFAAIEQNLIASGVDPLVAADVSQQIAFNPNLTQTELATNLANSFGNNIYDVNMATATPTAATTNTTGLTDAQLSNLVKAGIGLLGTGAAVNAAGGGGNATLQAPTQGMPAYTPDYYQQLQQYYNSYLPQTPRDVVSPLQQWYSQTYSGGNMQQPQQPSGTANGTMQAAPVTAPTASGMAPVAPVTPMAPVAPATPTGLFTTGMGSSPARTGPQEPLNSMNLPVAGPTQAERDAALARQNAELEARRVRRAAFEQSGLPGQFTLSGYAPGQGTYSTETGQAEQPYVYANGMFSRAPSNVNVAAQPPAPTPAPQDNWMSTLAVDPNAAPANFDWQKYVAINTDLQAAGVDTPTEALRHYLYYGKQENRRLS